TRVHTFSFLVTLVPAGTQTVPSTAPFRSSVTGSAAVTVNPAAAVILTVSAPASSTAGQAFSITVTAKDAFGNTATGYLGTVHFTKSDSGIGSAVPANYTFVAADSGVHTFP